MKIFSDDPKPVKYKMRADTGWRSFRNTMMAGGAAFIVSLAIPESDLSQIAFAIMFVVFAVGADLRDRQLEIFRLLKGDM